MKIPNELPTSNNMDEYDADIDGFEGVDEDDSGNNGNESGPDWKKYAIIGGVVLAIIVVFFGISMAMGSSNKKDDSQKDVATTESTKESTKDSSNGSTKDSSKESTKDSSNGSTKDSSKSSTKDSTKDSLTESTTISQDKQDSNLSVKDNSGDSNSNVDIVRARIESSLPSLTLNNKTFTVNDGVNVSVTSEQSGSDVITHLTSNGQTFAEVITSGDNDTVKLLNGYQNYITESQSSK